MPHSLASIAERAGVSVATVSLALRGKGPVARKTAERIKIIAEEMGYRPNPMLASLATKRFRSASSNGGTPLAIFDFPALMEHHRDLPNFYLEDLVREASQLGYAPKIYQLENGSKTGSLFRELYHCMVQGVIVSGSMDMRGFGQEFDWSQFSVLTCARFHDSLPFHTVRPNIFKSVKLAFNELRARGYKRIGFAMGTHPEAMEDDEARHGSAVALEYSYLPKRDRLPVYLGPFKDESALIAWMEKNKPDAVLGFAPSQYWLLRDHGYRIPEDLGFASMHLTGEKEKQLCSGLVQNTDEIARQCVRILDVLIRNREKGMPRHPLDILVASSWNEGTTLRRRE